MLTNEGYFEIGYVFTYLAIGLILVNIVGMSGALLQTSNDVSIDILLQEVADRLAAELNDAIAILCAYPDATINKSFTFQTQLEGSNAAYNYKLVATNTSVYINSGHIRARARVYAPNNIMVTGVVEGIILVRETNVGGHKTISISGRPFEAGSRITI